jgi:MFS family permease
VFAVAAVSGPVIGGWLTDTVGWRWAFWINLPVGLVAIVAALVLLPASPRPVRRVRFDLGGALVLAAAVNLLVLLTAWAGTRLPWTSPLLVGLAVAAVVAVLVFLRIEARTADPVLPLACWPRATWRWPSAPACCSASRCSDHRLPAQLPAAGPGPDPDPGRTDDAHSDRRAGPGHHRGARLVRRTGRYKALPVVGAAVVAAALLGWPRSTRATACRRSGSTSSPSARASAVPGGARAGRAERGAPDQVGVATAANGFFRELGVLLGTALVGALFAARLGSLLAERLPGSGIGIDPRQRHARNDCASCHRTCVTYSPARTPTR